MVKALRHPTRLSVLFNHRSARTPSRKPSPGPHSQGPQPPRLTARPDAVRKQARGKQRDRSPKRGGEGRELLKGAPRTRSSPLAGPRGQRVQRPVKVTGPAGRDGEGGLEPRPESRGPAGPSPHPGLGLTPRGRAAPGVLVSGAGPVRLGAEARRRFRAGGRRGGKAAGSQACADGGRGPALRRASQEEGPRRIPGLAAWPGPARPPGAPPCPPPRRVPPLHGPAQPRGPPRPPPARRPLLTCPPPAAPAAALPPRALRRVLAPPLGLSGRSARWRSSAQPVAGPRAEQAARVPPPHPSRVLRGARPPGASLFPTPRHLPAFRSDPAARCPPSPSVRPSAPPPRPTPTRDRSWPRPPSARVRPAVPARPPGRTDGQKVEWWVRGAWAGGFVSTDFRFLSAVSPTALDSGSPASSTQPGFGLHRPAVARTLASRYSRNPPASTSDHPHPPRPPTIPHDPPAACPSFRLPSTRIL